MSVTIYGVAKNICFGNDLSFATIPIVNLPDGTIQVRRRIRNGDFLRVFTRTIDGITAWHAKRLEGATPADNALTLCFPIGQNKRESGQSSATAGHR